MLSLSCYLNMMETYHGHVRTPADAIILFEACRLGLLPRVQRRLSEKERQQIKSGSVFVWDEREAGMRRWTDGKSWSASRVNGSFLTYREMEGKRGGGSNTSAPQPGPSTPLGDSQGNGAQAESGIDGPDGYRYKVDGLTKQSFSITTSTGQHLHLISYSVRQPPGSASKLTYPTNDVHLKHIRPAKGMYPESTVHDGHTMPAMTQSPMMGLSYASSPHQSSAASTPQYAQPRTLYHHPSSHGWPPSPMNTPPMHYSPHSNGYPASANHSPMSYYQHQDPHRVRAPPQGPTAFDRAPPPMTGSGLPQPPPSYGYNGYPAMPPTSAPPHPQSSSNQPSRPGSSEYRPQHHQNGSYVFPLPAEAHADHRPSVSTGQYHSNSSYTRTETQQAPNAAETTAARPGSSSGTIPSIGALINNSPPSSRDQNKQGNPSPTVTANPQNSNQASGENAPVSREDAKALRQLDKAFAA